MGFDERLKQWILHLRASPACRMTWGWGERLEEKTSSLKCAAPNGIKWTAFVLYQRHESIQIFFYLESILICCIQHQPNTNAHSINPKSMLIATDFLFFGFPSLKTFILRSMPLTCHSTRSRRWSRRIHKHRGLKDYFDSPLRKKTRLRVSITPPKIDKILERTVLL